VFSVTDIDSDYQIGAKRTTDFTDFGTDSHGFLDRGNPDESGCKQGTEGIDRGLRGLHGLLIAIPINRDFHFVSTRAQRAQRKVKKIYRRDRRERREDSPRVFTKCL